MGIIAVRHECLNCGSYVYCPVHPPRLPGVVYNCRADSCTLEGLAQEYNELAREYERLYASIPKLEPKTPLVPPVPGALL